MAKSVAIRRQGTRQWSLKPQDLLVGMKLFASGGLRVPYAVLANSVHLSQYEAHACVQRLLEARLCAVVEERPTVVTRALRALILHGARYCFPAILGEPTIGFPTFLEAGKRRRGRLPAESPFVWPHPDGTTRGQKLVPLYPNAPLAAIAEPELYGLLCAFDQLRAGQTRERREAETFLEQALE